MAQVLASLTDCSVQDKVYWLISVLLIIHQNKAVFLGKSLSHSHDFCILIIGQDKNADWLKSVLERSQNISVIDNGRNTDCQEHKEVSLIGIIYHQAKLGFIGSVVDNIPGIVHLLDRYSLNLLTTFCMFTVVTISLDLWRYAA
jgi:hypothetical protein